MSADRNTARSGLVYSTDTGRMCPFCRHAVTACACKGGTNALPSAPTGDGNLRVSREKAGRGGKTVTVVRGALLGEEALAALAKRLKTTCGSGGTSKDGVIEIQGEHTERIVAWLVQNGFRVKRAGG